MKTGMASNVNPACVCVGGWVEKGAGEGWGVNDWDASCCEHGNHSAAGVHGGCSPQPWTARARVLLTQCAWVHRHVLPGQQRGKLCGGFLLA